jgi:FAD/FMN-containing dehydrogenase
MIEHQLGGAVRRIDADATAFNHRDAEYSFLCIGSCAPGEDADKCVRWAREFWQAMQPYASSAMYVNYLGQEADEGADRIKAAYGPQKYQRLAALKKKYDPTNLFRLNQNIEPAA